MPTLSPTLTLPLTLTLHRRSVQPNRHKHITAQLLLVVNLQALILTLAEAERAAELSQAHHRVVAVHGKPQPLTLTPTLRQSPTRIPTLILILSLTSNP